MKEFNERSQNIFNTWPHDEKATRLLAHYAIKKGWKTAAVFGSKDRWVTTQSDIFQSEFESLGGIVKIRVDPLPNERELQVESQKIKESQVDFIFLSNYQTDVISKNLRDIHFNAPKIAILMEKERIKSAHGALEGTVFAQYEKPVDAFSKEFFNKYNQEPGITSDTAYDAVMLYAQAVNKIQSFEIDEIQSAMHRTKKFNGASGIFSVDEKGAVDKQPLLWSIHGTEYEQVQEE